MTAVQIRDFHEILAGKREPTTAELELIRKRISGVRRNRMNKRYCQSRESVSEEEWTAFQRSQPSVIRLPTMRSDRGRAGRNPGTAEREYHGGTIDG